eukprot:symbB.v1.2.024453.t1/scaffold2319.1/size82456/2
MEPGGGPTLTTSTSSSTSEQSLVPNQLAQLVPTFDPAKDDVLVYGQKVQLLLAAWPPGKYTELGTRLILGCSGSAFLKLQLHRSEVTGNDTKSIQRLVEILGGVWGQINLEKRYEYAERALADETADSYLARADIMWAELRARDIKLEDLEPYVTLRGSQLSPEDKKRVLMEVDAANSGKLTISKVAASIRMLGASFFHAMTGQRQIRGKTYDQSTLIADHQEADDHQPTMAMDVTEDFAEDEIMDALIQEGDEDAALVADFEGTATDVVQSDPELASALTAYTEARRRLSEKFRSRGFWPPSNFGKGKSKGGHRGPKGKFGKPGAPRKFKVTRNLPEVSRSPVVRLIMALAKRLQQVQTKVNEPLPDFSKMSLAELENEPITFGTAHKGQSYQEVWHSDQAWILWFTQHYGQSKKASHRQFLHFVELMVERAELTQEAVPVYEPNKHLPPASKDSGKPYPKGKCMAKPSIPPAGSDETEEDDIPSQFDMVEFPNEPVNATIGHLESRMLNLENALSQVIHHLENLAPQPAVPK